MNPTGWVNNPYSPTQITNPLNPFSPVYVGRIQAEQQAMVAQLSPQETPSGQQGIDKGDALAAILILIVAVMAAAGAVFASR